MKLITSFLTILLLSICGPSFSQSIQWELNFGGTDFEEAQSIAQTSDNGYIITGFSTSSDRDVSDNNGIVDYWVVKLDDQGDMEWEKNLGGNGDDRSWSVHQVADGGYIVAGQSESSSDDVSGNNGSRDIWIVKLDDQGSIEWEKNYGGSLGDGARSLAPTGDGGYIVTGSSESHDGDPPGNNGDYDVWVLKLDNKGGIDWQKNFGGSKAEFARDIKKTSDGGYIIAGGSESSDGDVSANNGNTDFWALKIDGSGNIDWEKNYGGSSDDAARSVQQTTDGGYILAGLSESSDGDVSGNLGESDFWVVKTDPSGKIVWEQNYGGSEDDQAKKIVQTVDGGYALAGESESSDGDVTNNKGNTDYWLLKLDSLGSFKWQNNYGGSSGDVLNDMAPAADGDYLLAGFSNSSDGDITGNKGRTDYWIVKVEGQNVGIVENQIGPGFQIYPNPTQGKVMIEPEKEYGIINLELRTITGEVVTSRKVPSNESFTFQIEGKPGYYFLYVKTRDGKQGTVKILKTN